MFYFGVYNSVYYTYSTVVFDTVIPETWCWELLFDYHSHAMNNTLAHSDNVTCGQTNTIYEGYKILVYLKYFLLYLKKTTGHYCVVKSSPIFFIIE